MRRSLIQGPDSARIALRARIVAPTVVPIYQDAGYIVRTQAESLNSIAMLKQRAEQGRLSGDIDNVHILIINQLKHHKQFFFSQSSFLIWKLCEVNHQLTNFSMNFVLNFRRFE